MSKFLFFSPHAAIWQHAFPEALLAESLQKAGHEIVYVGCERVLNEFCVAMSSIGLTQEATEEKKRAVCADCVIKKNIITSSFKFRSVSIDQQLSSEDLNGISKISEQITEENYLEFVLDGIEIGRLALYETLLQHKKSALHFSAAEWVHYKIALRNSLKSYFSLKKLFAIEKPDFYVCYNNLYSLNAVGAKIAEANHCLPYFIHGGLNIGHYFESLLIGQDSVLALLRDTMSVWAKRKNIPQIPSSMSQVTDHFVEIFKGRSDRAYSSAKSSESFDVYKKFSISREQKILVATMSSYDEAFASITAGAFPGFDGWLFKNQRDWISSLIQYFKDKPEYFLIIRVHPREFPNKRESVLSEHAIELQKVLQNLPPNIKVNWPTDGISIYDLAEYADVFLNAWSSVGKEMSLLGIPCVVFSENLFAYPASLNFIGLTETDYFHQIERALESGWNFERVRQTYRWYCLEFCDAGIDFSDSFKPTLIYKNQFFKRVAHRLKKILDSYYLEKNNCRRRVKQLKYSKQIQQIFQEKLHSSVLAEKHPLSASPASMETEYTALKKELRRLVQALYSNDLTITDSKSLKAKLLRAIGP